MSGRKYSQVELQNNIREAISCRLTAQEALARAESLVNALAEATKTTAALKPIVALAEATLNETRRKLDSLKTQFSESNMMQQTPSQVQSHRREVENLKTRLEEIAQKCRAGDNAAAQRAELAAVLDLLERNRNEHEPWLRDVYDKFAGETRALISQADHEIQTAGAMPTVAEKIPPQVARYNAMTDKVVERRKLDEERRYVGNALQKICKDMGFAVEFLPQKSPIEDLVLKVDTYAFGLIHFRLQLDGTIRSQSEMQEPACCLNFAQIEDQLKSLGIISSFRYEGDQSPVRLQKGSKSLPGSEPESGIALGGSMR